MQPIQESLQKISLKEIAQTPFAYALYVITLVLVSVIVTTRLDAAKAAEKCEKTTTEALKERDYYLKAYYVQKAIVDQIQKTVDSTAIENNKQQRK